MCLRCGVENIILQKNGFNVKNNMEIIMFQKKSILFIIKIIFFFSLVEQQFLVIYFEMVVKILLFDMLQNR